MKTSFFIALLIAIAILASLMLTAHAHAQTPPPLDPNQKFTIQCMMLTGCWWHPVGHPPDFWMLHLIYAPLRSYQYDAVWNVADWRWIPETPTQ